MFVILNVEGSFACYHYYFDICNLVQKVTFYWGLHNRVYT